MSQIELVQASALRPVVNSLSRRGVDVDRYLQQARIPAKLLELSYAPLAKRNGIWAFLENVERSEHIDTLGFLLGDRLNLIETGPFGINIAQAATLHDAIQTTRDLSPNFAQGNEVRVIRDGDTTWLTVQTHNSTCRPADHYALKFLMAVVRLATGPDWSPSKATLRTGKVSAISKLPSFRNCEIKFNANRVAIALPPRILSRPLQQVEDNFLQVAPNLLPLPDPKRLSDSLRVIIATLLPHQGAPSAHEAAAMAGISRATLFRKLSAEGTTYKQLIERVRYQAAQQLLRNPSMPIKEIGYLLGYSLPNNFIRAFRKIAGITPDVFRQERLAG